MAGNGSVLSQADINHLNFGRKRPISPEEWKDKAAKVKRNLGLPYENREGTQRPDKSLPSGLKVCNCAKSGCDVNIITPQRKLKLFHDFWCTGSHDCQSLILAAGIQRMPPKVTTRPPGQSKRKSTCIYQVMDDNGVTREVCKKTFMNIYKVSRKRVRNVFLKIRNGDSAPSDHRGQHANRPHSHSAQDIATVTDHIKSFPTYLSHYSRDTQEDPEEGYLSIDLTVAKMFREFNAVVGHEVDSWEWLYRRVFRDLNMKFGPPRSDTCGICDKYYVQLSQVTPGPEFDRISDASLAHHLEAEDGYTELGKDSEKSKTDRNFVVFCVDLQQVLLSPKLTNGEFYYQRKFLSYNFGIVEPGVDKSTMCYWMENEGKRGSLEIASCILKYVTTNFQILQQGEKRTLTVWSDRCGGQNNNWLLICIYKYLIQRNYFSEIHQKFLVTGHSFLPCDRQFAKIESKKRTATIFIPTDWIKIIEEAQPSNPFVVQRMSRQDFKNFKNLLKVTPKPVTLKVRNVMLVRLADSNPNQIYTRENYAAPWKAHNHPNNRNVLWSPQGFQGLIFRPNYPAQIPVNPLKKQDLLEMLAFLPQHAHSFYISLL